MAQKTMSLKAVNGAQLAEAAAQKPRDSVSALLARMAPEIKRALPRNMDVDKITRVAMTDIRNNPKLGECSAQSLASSIMRASQLGLEIGGDLGYAYLVPYGSECQLQVGYRGWLELVRRSGLVSEIYSYAVRKGDLFVHRLGLARDIIHEPSEQRDMSDAGITHVYAVARLKDGGLYFEVMERSDVDRIRARSRSGSGGPWKTDYEQMARKTVLKRLCKTLPCSSEQMQTLVRESAQEDAVEFAPGIIDTVGAEVEPPHDEETGEVVDVAVEEEN